MAKAPILTCSGWVVERTGQRCVLAYGHDGTHAPDRQHVSITDKTLEFIEWTGLLAYGSRLGWRGWSPWHLRRTLRELSERTNAFLDEQSEIAIR